MSKSLVLLSGEDTSLPAAEARALFLTYDPGSKFSLPERRVLIAESKAEPRLVARRVAFARRVGLLLEDPAEVADLLKGRRTRLSAFRTTPKRASVDPARLLSRVDTQVDLNDPDFEITVIDGEKRYLALTVPREMNQDWHLRSPRRRAYFHPSAIFPKLSRALVNLTRCRESQILLDPFAGTGSLLLEAALVGAQPLAIDQTAAMSGGSLANMKRFGQSWLGVVRADSFALPLTQVDAIATDAPYGRASSTRGRGAATVIQRALELLPGVLKQDCRMVMMHPKEIPVQSTNQLEVEEEHHLYIHKRLTRAITVLRKR